MIHHNCDNHVLKKKKKKTILEGVLFFYSADHEDRGSDRTINNICRLLKDDYLSFIKEIRTRKKIYLSIPSRVLKNCKYNNIMPIISAATSLLIQKKYNILTLYGFMY